MAHNAVNAPALPAKTLRALAPYVRLAERMGSFLAQRCSEPIRKVELTFGGSAVEAEPSYLELAFLTALLRQGLGRGVNFVNAPLLAQERGIRVLRATSDESSSFTNRIKARVSARGGEESHLVAGTVFGNEPRFTRIDAVHVDLDPRGTVLLTRHHDRPGALGSIATVLGSHGVNIRRMELGPGADTDGLSSAFLTLDMVPDESVLVELRALEPIEELRTITL